MDVVFEVGEEQFTIAAEPQATIMGENLRRKAAGLLGDYGQEGARRLADAIEDVLVGRSSEPIRLEADDEIDAMFYMLDVSLDPRHPDNRDVLRLYVEVVRLHRLRYPDTLDPDELGGSFPDSE